MKHLFLKVPFLVFFTALFFTACSEEETINEANETANLQKLINFSHYGEMHNKVLGELLNSDDFASIETVQDMLLLTKTSFIKAYPEIENEIENEQIRDYSFIFDLDADFSHNSINSLYVPIGELSQPFQTFLNNEIGAWDGITLSEIDELKTQLSGNELELARAFEEIYFSSKEFWSTTNKNIQKCSTTRQERLAARNQVYFFDALGGVLGGLLSGGTASVLAGVGASALVDNIQEGNYCGGPIND